MEIDRIQAVKGLKVERTGSEQERRRRPQTEEDFSELLESSMSEELADEESGQQQPPPRERPRDTVSITSGQVQPPVVSDLVSISTKALVNAEMHQASRSVEDNLDAPVQGPDTYIPERRINLDPDVVEKLKDRQPPPEKETGDEKDDEDEVPVKIDTLA